MQNFKSKTCIETHVVENLKEKIRLQEYGLNIFQSIQSKSALKKTLKKELITLDGHIANTSNWIENGQVLKLYAEEIQVKKKIFNLKLEVLYEDEFLAVIHKLAGYPTNGNYFKTIENALPFNLKDSLEKDKLPFPQPVHRLDNPTSGILLIAKTQSTKSLLSVLFEDHKIQKKYSAIVEGSLDHEQGEFNKDVDGKRSLTKFQVKKVFQKEGKVYSLIDMWPETGRTHQLRIHLSSQGSPIVGDTIYGEKNKKGSLILHASSLKFVHPKTQKRLFIETELPHKFVKFIDGLK
ncbi:RluA family pseudouridine synthase [Psychroflexus sp. CAK8W]|uniref:RluA family pseudouridine synthase n=1 Tax=Psychroflexus longus TaxID=2873596 RepID=A0ABS7XL76_9FLAO|nr:RluA family pseudouridine synthase [Psychroflexus longus]MBZ9779727.1 RluA family pseudouridine synthase [Psychroflexus longus]